MTFRQFKIRIWISPLVAGAILCSFFSSWIPLATEAKVPREASTKTPAKQGLSSASSPSPKAKKKQSSLTAEEQNQIAANSLSIKDAIDMREPYFLDLEGSSSQALFSKPMFSPESSCTPPTCETVLRIDNQMELMPTGNVQNKKIYVDGRWQIKSWTEVRVINEKGEIKTGWIDHQLLIHQKRSLLDNYRADVQNEPTNKLKEESKLAQLVAACGAAWRHRDPRESFVPGIADIHGLRERFLEAQKKPWSKEKIAQSLTGLAGVCALKNPTNPQLKDFNSGTQSEQSAQLSYDASVLPALIRGLPQKTAEGKLTSQKSTAQNSLNPKPNMNSVITQVQSLNIPRLNFQKFIEIDALARTLYAEMGKKECSQQGPEYLQAVARVIKNREEEIIKSPQKFQTFIFQEEGNLHWPGKSLSTKISTSPIQFSAWNKYIIDSESLSAAREEEAKKLMASGLSQKNAIEEARKKIKPDRQVDPPLFYKFNADGIKQTLCPPSDPQAIFHDGGKPSAELHAIWQTALETAIEAVMEPEKFKLKTQGVGNILHYTSNRNSFYDMEEVAVSLGGKKLTNGKCLNFWKEKK